MIVPLGLCLDTANAYYYFKKYQNVFLLKTFKFQNGLSASVNVPIIRH